MHRQRRLDRRGAAGGQPGGVYRGEGGGGRPDARALGRARRARHPRQRRGAQHGPDGGEHRGGGRGCPLRRDGAYHRRRALPRERRRLRHHRPGAADHRSLIVELRGRVALVTGAGQRLGRAFAAALAGRGMAVALHYNAAAAGATSLRDEIRGGGGRAECFAADLTDGAAARALPDSVVAAMGGLDVLVNSAAVMHRIAFDETTVEQYDAILDLNLRSLFFVTQGAAPALRRARGKVVNIADLGGLEPWPSYPTHSLSKAGVVMLTKE